MARKDISANLESIGIRLQVETAKFLIEETPTEIRRALQALALAEHRARIIPRPLPLRNQISEVPAAPSWAARQSRAALQLRRSLCGLWMRTGLARSAGHDARPEPSQRRRKGV